MRYTHGHGEQLSEQKGSIKRNVIDAPAPHILCGHWHVSAGQCQRDTCTVHSAGDTVQNVYNLGEGCKGYHENHGADQKKHLGRYSKSVSLWFWLEMQLHGRPSTDKDHKAQDRFCIAHSMYLVLKGEPKPFPSMHERGQTSVLCAQVTCLRNSGPSRG